MATTTWTTRTQWTTSGTNRPEEAHPQRPHRLARRRIHRQRNLPPCRRRDPYRSIRNPHRLVVEEAARLHCQGSRSELCRAWLVRVPQIAQQGRRQRRQRRWRRLQIDPEQQQRQLRPPPHPRFSIPSVAPRGKAQRHRPRLAAPIAVHTRTARRFKCSMRRRRRRRPSLLQGEEGVQPPRRQLQLCDRDRRPRRRQQRINRLCSAQRMSRRCRARRAASRTNQPGGPLNQPDPLSPRRGPFRRRRMVRIWSILPLRRRSQDPDQDPGQGPSRQCRQQIQHQQRRRLRL